MSLSKPSTSATGTRPKGKILHSQERAMILKIYTFLMNCRLKKCVLKQFSKCKELRARAFNVSVSTVARILKRKNINYRNWCIYI
jgi:hypothetical protein